MQMQPEKSRMWVYDYIKNNRYSTWKVDYDKIDVPIRYLLYGTENINEEIVDEIVNTIKCSLKTITYEDLSSLLDEIIIHYIDNVTMLVVLKPNESSVGFVAGRQSSNLFAIKRLMSNLSGKYKRAFKRNITITIDIHQFIK